MLLCLIMKTQNYTPTFFVRFVQFGLAIGMSLSLMLAVGSLATGSDYAALGGVLFFTFALTNLAVTLNRSPANVHHPLEAPKT